MPKHLLPLLNELADGEFHSGDDLGLALGVTRAAIWKLSKKIAELGVELHSVRGKGYRLSRALDLLARDRLLAEFDLLQLERVSELELCLVVDSTNSHAMRRIQNAELDLANGKVFICLAEQQLAGKGRRGREWVSPFGSNMYLTVVREFESGALGLEGLSLVVGLALVRALTQCGVTGLGVKWPNDIYWENKKLAGILLEMTGDVTDVCQVVIGVGLNIQVERDDMDDVAQPWADLTSTNASLPGRNCLIAKVIVELVNALEKFELCGFEWFMEEWNALDVLNGEQVKLMRNNVESVEGIAAGVNQSGALLLKTKEGLQTFYGGEVSLRKAHVL